MSKKTIALILCMVMALTMGLGGTLAYLTDRDAKTNIFTVGNVDIELDEDFEQGAELIPGVDVEKNPTIKNTGSTDAYVWMTIAVPSYAEGEDSKNLVHWDSIDEVCVNALGDTATITEEQLQTYKDNGWMDEDVTLEQIQNGDFWIRSAETSTETIDGVKCNVYTFMYNNPLASEEETISGPLYNVSLDTHIDIDPDGNMFWVDNGDVADCNWNINENGNPKFYVAAYATQTEGFENVEEAYEAYNTQWGENGGVEYAQGVEVTNSEEFVKALSADESQIVIELADDVTVDVNAWQLLPMGGDSTREIVIFGNGNTITFNQLNSDWNNIATKNDAKLVIRDANITNSGHNDGPWNRHDLNFACDVELYNVNSDKAIALKAGGILKDVTINDANGSDTYAIWIQPNGQNVELDGCTIDMIDCADGRGIAINDQYFKGGDDAGADATEQLPVTLKITDTVFKTEEKAAIIVKTCVGSTIVLDNVDISEVAADTDNPVWVDEDRRAEADLVTVTGGSKIVEP